MRKLSVLLVLLTSFASASACGIERMGKSGFLRGNFLYEPMRIHPVSKRLMNYKNGCASSLMCTAYSGRSFLYPQGTINALTGYYSGIPFDREAVFCRMENHFLNNYGVKFSIHAGGYRE